MVNITSAFRDNDGAAGAQSRVVVTAVTSGAASAVVAMPVARELSVVPAGPGNGGDAGIRN